MASAPRASAATSSSGAPPRAATAAATVPSTSGASLISTRPPPSSISIANSVLISALPRSMSTSTPSSDIARSIAARTRSASVPSAPGSSIPPAASSASSSPPISRASATTPSASASLWETTTRPTKLRVRRRGAADRSGAPRDARWPGDLPAAGLAVAGHRRRARGADLIEQVGADRHRDVVLLGLQPVRAGDAAAAGVHLGHLQAGDQRQQLERRLADPVALLLAGRVVGDRVVDGLEVGLQFAAVVQLEQQLADVVGALGDQLEVGIVLEVEDLARLALEHQRAARRVADDERVVVAHVRGQVARQAQDDLARVVEEAAGLQRQPAAVLLGDLDLEAVVLEDGDELLALFGLVVLGAAAVEVDDLASGPRALVLARPAREAPPGEVRRGRVAMDLQQLLAEDPQRALVDRPVGELGRRRPRPA